MRSKILTNYNRLKKVKLIKPTLKRYLNGHVKSDFRRVLGDEFTIATLLPVARFKKGGMSQAWSDARKML
jgi:hypothetical protein